MEYKPTVAASTLYNDKFLGYIRAWYADFKQKADAVLNSGKKLYVIAISRKMPRLFNWMLSHDLGLDGLQDILDRSEYTTEHALPFLFYDEPRDFEIIIVDDSTIIGSTIRRVVEDVKLFAGGKKPMVSIIASLKNSEVRHLIDFPGHVYNNPAEITSVNTTLSSTQLDIEEITDWLEFVSDCISESELPVDVEFPILHIPGLNESSDLENVIANYVSYDWYELGNAHNQSSVNVLLDDDLVDLTSLDFSKARCFFKGSEAKLAIFSPFVILENSIYKEDKFYDKTLNNAWQLILNAASAIGSSRTGYSMVVMLNYLNSLNTFKRNREFLLPKRSYSVSLKQSDLQLLVGKKLSERLIELLSTILTSGDNEKYTIRRLSLPDECVPELLKEAYEIQKSFIAAKQMNSDKDVSERIERIVTDIFDQARYDRSVLKQNATTYHRMHSTFFESYASLARVLKMYLGREVVSYADINEVIDKLIDTGRVIPKYVRVISDEGEYYWRRYFTCAHSSAEI